MDRATTPPPLQWHPAYRRYTALIEWLNDPAGPHTMEIPVTPPIKVGEDPAELSPLLDTPRTIRLTKRTAWGLAPYVGDPFIYTWHVATDHLGRSISGESTIAYMAGLT